ncbi:MAG: IPT/TIG domain-containing protein [bacterium]|nr:IPT/TIG domain-containing protein [bacterium]
MQIGLKKAASSMLCLFLSLAAFSPAWTAENETRAIDKETCTGSIFALMPSQAEPSSPIKVYVTDLPKKARFYIGENRVPHNIIEEDLVSIGTPNILAGSFPLYFKGLDGCKSNIVSLKIKEARPVISSLTPDQIYYCTPSKDRIALLKGDNFSRKTKVLFDNIVVGSNYVSEKQMEVKIPQAKSGLHRIKAVNPAGGMSLSHNFYIEGTPVIYDVSIGISYDEHYELIIEGENFLWGALPIVGGEEVKGETTYKGCNMLVYDRYPKSKTPIDISLEVSNPDGDKSNSFHLSTP